MSIQSKYKSCSTSRLRELILKRDKNSDEAAFYLLRYRMQEKFSAMYNKSKPKMDFDDVMMDFYLYLRNSKQDTDKMPFHAIEGLRSWWAFDSWLTTTFRHYLIGLIKKDVNTCSDNRLETIADCQESNNDKLDKEINILAHAVAFKERWGTAEDKFILYRSLMYSLDKNKMIGRKDMALAMGLTDVNYRTKDSRLRKNLKDIIEKMRSRGSLNSFQLDERTLAVKEDIEKNYVDFFSVVARLYENALSQLQAQREIEELRQKDLEEQKRKEAEKKAAEMTRTENNNESGTRYSVRDSSGSSSPRYSVRSGSTRLVEPKLHEDLTIISNEEIKDLMKKQFQEEAKKQQISEIRYRTREVREPEPVEEFKVDFSDLNPRKHFINSIIKFVDSEL